MKYENELKENINENQNFICKKKTKKNITTHNAKETPLLKTDIINSMNKTISKIKIEHFEKFIVQIFDYQKFKSMIKIFTDKVIYSLIDNYTAWVDEDKLHEEDAIFSELTPVAKFTFLKGYIFRNNDPAVFGIRVDVGTLRQKVQFMNKNGKRIGIIHQLQEDKKTVNFVKAGTEVACSVQGVTIGRQIHEEDIFYTLPPSHEAKQLLKKFAHKLSSEEIATLNNIVAIQRKIDTAYAY
jgi:translation initiation factor IF-2